MGEEIVNRIFDLMKKKNITQVQLATYLNIKQGTVAGWKQRNCPPPIEQILKIIELLDTSITYIATGETEESNNHLSAEEKQLINLYRIADQRGKRSIIRTAEAETRELELSTSKISQTENNNSIKIG